MIRRDDGAAGPGGGPQLVLGSASPGRAEVLTRARVSFRVVVSAVDEEAVGATRPGASPRELAVLLAEAKGRDVAARVAAEGVEAPTLVLGCDSVFELDGVAYGKPYEPEVALERWRAQAGRTGTLHSGHWLGLVAPGAGTPPESDTAAGLPGGDVAGRRSSPVDLADLPQVSGPVSADVRFAAVTEAEARAYVATGEPLHCAGAFTVDGAGAALIDGVDGDPNAVIGLSVSWLRAACGRLGVDFTQWWM
ncbi:Maf family protein [Micrococcus porci]|uniref:Maf family protein n=1 Tax=Micrococcus porci TaxID=2856555 RepID=UPI003CF74D0F